MKLYFMSGGKMKTTHPSIAKISKPNGYWNQEQSGDQNVYDESLDGPDTK